MLSKASLLICVLLLFSSGSIFHPRWSQRGGEAQLGWDAGGYYWYLPATFIYHDLKSQKFKDSLLEKYQPTPGSFQYAFQPNGTDNYVMKYTMGIAILEMPAFFLAHISASFFGYPADGFSRPYQVAIYLEGLLFALIGLYYLRKLMLFYYSDAIVGVILFLLVFGSNYLSYAGINMGMTHSWLFTLVVLLMYNTHLFYTTHKKEYIYKLGIIIGFVGLIRPPEIIVLLIPFLWDMEIFSIVSLKTRVRKALANKQAILIAGAMSCVILSLQFIYWKWASGHWFVYSYQDQGFSWLSPHFKQYALNYQCGWLLYTPIMFFAITGIPFFIKKGKNRVAIIVVIIVNYYIVSAWDAWDYGGRAMVQNYPVLLFPMASFLTYIFGSKLRTFIVVPLLLLCTYFNLWWTYPDKGTLIGSAPATGRFYWKTIFRYDAPLVFQKLRDNVDEYLDPVRVKKLIYQAPLGDTIVGDKEVSFIVDKPDLEGKYIRAAAKFSVKQKEWNVWYMTQILIRIRKGDQVLQENSIRAQRLLEDNESKRISVDAKIRNKEYDNIQILFRNDNKGSLPCIIDSLEVFLFDDQK